MSDIELLPTSAYLANIATRDRDLLACGVVLTNERLVDTWAANSATEKAQRAARRTRIRLASLTPRQKEILRSFEAHGNATSAAKALGVSSTRVRAVATRLRRLGLLSPTGGTK